jgi:uncharacterized membrane protein
MKKFTLVDLLALVIGLLPVGYLLWVYASLPSIVALHYGADGKPNGFGPKSELFVLQGILTGVSFLVYLLMKFLPAIDPKKQVKYGEKTLQKLGFGMVVFMAVLSISIVFSTLSQKFPVDKLVLVITGLLFIFLGNIMYSIKPNYFVGVRTPWTLEDEGNWRATHRLTGKLWVIGGIVITIIRLMISSEAGSYIFLGCIAVMVIVPIVYSFVYFKKHQLK